MHSNSSKRWSFWWARKISARSAHWQKLAQSRPAPFSIPRGARIWSSELSVKNGLADPLKFRRLVRITGQHRCGLFLADHFHKRHAQAIESIRQLIAVLHRANQY